MDTTTTTVEDLREDLREILGDGPGRHLDGLAVAAAIAAAIHPDADRAEIDAAAAAEIGRARAALTSPWSIR